MLYKYIFKKVLLTNKHKIERKDFTDINDNNKL